MRDGARERARRAAREERDRRDAMSRRRPYEHPDDRGGIEPIWMVPLFAVGATCAILIVVGIIVELGIN